MRRVLLAAAVALAVAAPASAAAPEGFVHSWRLTPTAKKMSGEPAAKIYCAKTKTQWAAFVRERHPDSDPRITPGVTVYADEAAYLAPQICRTLENWKRGRAVSNRALAFAILVFAHETQHLRGIRSEYAAQCRAVRSFHTVARVHFGVKSVAKRRALLATIRAETAGCYA